MTDRYVEVTTEFCFEAAHFFGHFPEGHPNRRIHGHSFRVQLTVGGEPDPMTGFVHDFAELESTAAVIRERLDHQFLNEIADLGPPSLENLSIWIWRRAEDRLGGTTRVTVFRDSCRQMCTYSGPKMRDGAQQQDHHPRFANEHVSDLEKRAMIR